MKITSKHVEDVCQALYELQPRCKIVRKPDPAIVVPGKEPEPQFRAWLSPDDQHDFNQSVPHYDGNQRDCTIYLARETMRIALEKVFGGSETAANEPRDSLPQSDGDTSA